MITELFRFVRFHFRQTKNGLMQIVLLNVLSFLSLLFLRTGLVLFGRKAFYTTLLQSLTLSSSWASYLHQPWTLLTYGWVHTSFFSTIWGLVILYTLGQIVVNLIGQRHFIFLYLLGGVGGGGFFLLLYHLSPHLKSTYALLFGFSGSLYAIVIAAATLAPQLNFYFLFVGPVKLKHIASFLVLLSLIDLSSARPSDSIAQLGGALLGYLYVKQLYGYSQLRQYWRHLWKAKNKLKVSYRNASTSSDKGDERATVDHAHLDRILDKVAELGYEGLSEVERKQLFEAGQHNK